jgi:hypothetical protein
VALEGRGWVSTAIENGSVVPCPVGTYNAQHFTRAPTSAVTDPPFGCRRCPSGLTTLAEGTTLAGGCLAPAGYYLKVGQAAACPIGTFKPAAGNVDCTACPEGLTTEANACASGGDCRGEALEARGCHAHALTQPSMHFSDSENGSGTGQPKLPITTPTTHKSQK